MRLEQSLREANAKIQHLSITDTLVGTFNRRYLNDQLMHEVERSRRYAHPLAAVMADLDFFKKVNDQHGHQVGDDVLRAFVDVSKGQIAGAARMAEKIRSVCAASPFATAVGPLTVTASFGVAALDSSNGPVGAAAEALLRQADAALYRSKHEGRNRVTVADRFRVEGRTR